MKAPSTPSPFEEARDELFQHIMRCGVVGSTPEHQDEWFNETYVKEWGEKNDTEVIVDNTMRNGGAV